DRRGRLRGLNRYERSRRETPVDALFALSQRVAYSLLRIAMGIVLLWIGVVHVIDPSPVVALLGVSLPFLAFSGFVYLLRAFEIVLAVALCAGIAVRYVSLALMGLFLSTLLIFVITPQVDYGDRGFPVLLLMGQFLLKDVALLAASVSLVAMATERATARQP